MSVNEMDRPPRLAAGETASLTSWKEIAARLQVSVKTAQKYETEQGLPVRRLGGRVSIAVSDLMAWQLGNAKANPWWANVQNLQIALAVCGTLTIISISTLSVYLFSQRTGPPASVHLDGSLLTVKDKAGRTVWQHAFPTPITPIGSARRMPHHVTDIDKDGELETVGVWQHMLRDADGWGLHCFSAKGKVRWQLLLEDRVRTASGKEFGPPYVIRAFTLFESPERDGTQWAVAAFVHVVDSLSTLIVVDSRGKRRGQYWHSGHLNAVQMFDADGDGKDDIVAGGVRHGVERAILVAFDPARVEGANAMPANHPLAVMEKGPSSEKMTGLFGRSTLSRESDPFNFLQELQLVNGNLRAMVFESLRPPEGYLIYEFKPGLLVNDLTLTASFLTGTRVMQGRLKLGEVIPEEELKRLREEFRVETAR